MALLGKSWITSTLGVGTIGSALASLGIDLVNKQTPDWSQLFMVIASVGSGGIGLAAKDKNVTGGTVSAITGDALKAPVSLVDAAKSGVILIAGATGPTQRNPF